jgi:hypothetical protein
MSEEYERADRAMNKVLLFFIVFVALGFASHLRFGGKNLNAS